MIKFEIIDLLKIASEAKKLSRLEKSIRTLKGAYHDALDEWKALNGVVYVDRNSEQWDNMLNYANKEWEALDKAKRDYRNTLRRLINATKKVDL